MGIMPPAKSSEAPGDLGRVAPWTIEPLLQAYRAGGLGPEEVANWSLERARKLDPDGRVFVGFDAERTLRTARRLEKRGFTENLPLYGVPVSIKDVILIKGLPTRCGSPHQPAALATKDARVVHKLERAGAIIVGKAATTEFAAAGYHPDLQPPPNPLSHDHVAGVSSSGSAASVAAGIVLGSVGTDTGGSIRMPAAACGLVGLKPTFGSISRAGIVPLASSLDHCGPIARCVDDAARLFDVLSGPDLDDPATLRMFRRVKSTAVAAPLKIGWDDRLSMESVDESMQCSVRAARQHLSDAGHQIVPIDLSEIGVLNAYWKDVVACEFSLTARDRIASPELLGPVISDILAHADTVQGARISEAFRLRDVLISSMHRIFRAVDALLMPAEPFSTRTWHEFPPQFVTPHRALARALRFAVPFNFSGCPSLVLPCGLADSGLPASVQLAAPWHAELRLFQLARELERAAACQQAVAARDQLILREQVG